MAKKRAILQALVFLAVVWALVSGIRAIAGSQRVTSEKIAEAIEARPLDDWSELAAAPDAGQAAERDAHLQEVAGLFNRLDFAEREKAREQRIGEEFFRRLSNPEKERFIDLTIEQSMKTFMTALDALPAKERRRYVERGLREIEEGRTEEEMQRARELSEDLLARISEEGMKAYFEEASADTKLDLAPLMEAMNELMQGLRGNEFGPARQQ